MLTATLDVVKEDQTSVKPLLVQFTNGDVNQNCCESLKFSLYKSSNSEDVRKKHRRTLVAETDKMKYSGNNFGMVARSSSLCKYLVGVYHKKNGTMDVYDAKSFKLQPKISTDHSIADQTDGQESNADLSYIEKNDQLVEAFGSTRRKKAMKTRLQNVIDSEQLGNSVSNAVTHMLNQSHQEVFEGSSNTEDNDMLPRFNKNGKTTAEIYPLSCILARTDFDALKHPLMKIIADLKQNMGTWRTEKRFNEYVLDHLEVLPLNESDRIQKASCLLYFFYFVQFYQLNYKALRRKDPLPDVPDAIKNKLFSLFSLQQGRTRCVPRRLKDKLVCHLIVLALIIDGFTIDCMVLCKDLKMSVQRFCNYAKAVGCRIESSQGIRKRKLDEDGPAVFKRAVLQVPLPKDFPNHMPVVSRKK